MPTDVAARGRLFFTTIPKCGKNLVYMFLRGLGVERAQGPERDVATYGIHLASIPRADRRATYALPAGLASDAAAAGAMTELRQRLLRMPDGTSYQGHFVYDQQLHEVILEAGVPLVFVYRDPRDCLVSMANYVLHKSLPVHLVDKVGRLQLEPALELLLRGDHELVPFAEYFDAFQGWRGAEGVLELRFEDIVGPQGSGDPERQRETFARLAGHMGFRGNAEQVASAVEGVFSTTVGTFHRGQVGAWREAFTRHIREQFEARCGDLVARWGYL